MDVDLGQLGQPLAHNKDRSSEADEIHIGKDVAKELDDVLRTHQNPVFICDSDSRAAAEPFLEEEFKDCLVIELDPEELAADEENRARVMSQLEVCDLGQSSVPVDLLVAVGGRIIHDLTRIAAAEYEVSFVSVPAGPEAACSGQDSAWTGPEAADAAKMTVPDLIPRWIYADPEILGAAEAGRSEKEECLTRALLACGIKEELFREKLEHCEDL